jgi:hypothetical protein
MVKVGLLTSPDQRQSSARPVRTPSSGAEVAVEQDRRARRDAVGEPATHGHSLSF